MLMVCLAYDPLVVPRNTTATLDVMRNKGVGNTVLRECIIRRKGLDHEKAEPRALAIARLFFDAGYANLPSNP